MGFSFRKSKKFGPLRVSIGKRGISTSVGVKGARVRLNSRGQVYGSLGAKGMRYQKRLNPSRRGGTSPGYEATSVGGSGWVTGFLVAIGTAGAGLLALIVGCGVLALLMPSGAPQRTASPQVSENDKPVRSALVTSPPIALVQESSDGDAATGDEEASGAPGPVPEVQAASQTGQEAELQRAPTSEETATARGPPRPSLPEPEQRTWTDAAGTHSTVATLVNFKDGYVQLERVDNGKRIAIPVSKLSKADQTYVRYITVPRRIADAALLIGRVSRVLDGDTLQVDDLATGMQTVRLEGIDAPEKDQRFGTDAQRWLIHEVSGRDVHVEVTGTDRYQRKLGHLYVDDEWLNFELVKAGLAWHYVQYSDDVRLAAVQSEASVAARGLWQDARRVAPWDWRNGQRVETPLPVNRESTRESDVTVYITKTGSKYHRAGCQYLRKSSTPIPLSRAASGYSPCSRCSPPRE